MLPKRSRLTKQMIDVLMKNARKVRTAHFLVFYNFSENQENPYISITISKKYAKLAVLRNLFRRRGYAALKPLINKIKPEAKILVSYMIGDKKLTALDINKELDEVFEKNNLYKK